MNFRGFEGNYKSRRPISLGGVHSATEKDAILQRAHEERRRREEARERQKAAVVIQAGCAGNGVHVV